MRTNKLIKNTISSLILQIVTIFTGFVIPKLILESYGSEVNGLLNSITQFLSIIAFLELGVGAVVQSALYKPLAENNISKLNEIYASAQKFFSRLAKALCCYVIVLIFIYPLFSSNHFNITYVVSLIIIMSINSVAQYYFGIVNSLFLTADQKGYIQYNVQILTVVINTIFCIILIKAKFSIHIVKLTTALIYLIRPIYLNYYIKRKYNINKKIKLDYEPIEQKWNGVAQHIAAIILDGTDTIVLTIFADLKLVSVYSVYYLVVSGIKAMFNAMTTGVQALLGNIYARGCKEELIDTFKMTEWIIHLVTIFIMGIAACLITPFVLVYTNGVNDANYNQKLFGYLISFAYAAYCLRLPYHIMIRACGRYRETQKNYIFSAVINILISIIFVWRYGLVGVAIGTLCAMLFQAIGLARYNAKNIVGLSYIDMLKPFIIDILTMGIGILASNKVVNLTIINCNFLFWLGLAVKTTIIWIVVVSCINILFYRNNMIQILKRINKWEKK